MVVVVVVMVVVVVVVVVVAFFSHVKIRGQVRQLLVVCLERKNKGEIMGISSRAPTPLC